MILHTLNKSPDHPALNRCAGFISDGDCLILIEDGVYCAATNDSSTLNNLLLRQIPVFCLQADVEARGLLNRLNPAVQLIDYEGFVTLSTEQTKSKRWG